LGRGRYVFSPYRELADAGEIFLKLEHAQRST
jgi:hypothetical protein